jgi:hypothetical protein
MGQSNVAAVPPWTTQEPRLLTLRGLRASRIFCWDFLRWSCSTGADLAMVLLHRHYHARNRRRGFCPLHTAPHN